MTTSTIDEQLVLLTTNIQQLSAAIQSLYDMVAQQEVRLEQLEQKIAAAKSTPIRQNMGALSFDAAAPTTSLVEARH